MENNLKESIEAHTFFIVVLIKKDDTRLVFHHVASEDVDAPESDDYVFEPKWSKNSANATIIIAEEALDILEYVTSLPPEKKVGVYADMKDILFMEVIFGEKLKADLTS